MATSESKTAKEAALSGVTDHVEDPAYLPASMKTTPYMIFFAFYIALSGWMINFDLSYGGTVLQMESFRKTFGNCSPVTGVCTLTATAQSIVSLSALFSTVGAALSGLVGSYIGRRGTIQVGCLLIIIGAAAQCGTAGSYVAYNVCKCFSCVGMGHLNASAPMYGVETTPSQMRGALVSVYNIGLACGLLCANAVCYGTSTIGNTWEWRTPILLQIPLAIIYASGTLFFPESPRWLLTKGKEEKARLSFAKFYNKNPQSLEITAQVKEVETYIEFEKSLVSTTSWTELFYRSYIRRTLIALMVSAAPALSGIALVGNYAAVFFAANGVSKPFLVQVYLGVCGIAGSLCGPGLVEYVGRRKTAILGLACMSSCMLIFSSVASGVGGSTETARNILVAFLCIWFFWFAACISSSSWLVAAEVHSLRLRTYGVASSVATANLVNFAAAFWTPYMINPTAGNLGTKVGYFYFGLDVIFLCLFIVFLPETARLSLEQIDDYFASGRKAWKTSISRNKKIAQGEIYDVSPDAHEDARRTAELEWEHKE